MQNQPYDAYAKYAGRGGARTGSPFAVDRNFKRRVSVAGQWFRAVRDLLALAAFVTLLTAVLSALTVTPHWA